MYRTQQICRLQNLRSSGRKVQNIRTTFTLLHTLLLMFKAFITPIHSYVGLYRTVWNPNQATHFGMRSGARILSCRRKCMMHEPALSRIVWVCERSMQSHKDLSYSDKLVSRRRTKTSRWESFLDMWHLPNHLGVIFRVDAITQNQKNIYWCHRLSNHSGSGLTHSKAGSSWALCQGDRRGSSNNGRVLHAPISKHSSWEHSLFWLLFR